MLDQIALVLLRFAHIAYGIVWVGFLLFFYLVNVPFQRDITDDVKKRTNPALLLRAIYWVKNASVFTLIFGWGLFALKYVYMGLLWEGDKISNRGSWMLWGGLLGTLMAFNIWFVIAPNQSRLLHGLASGKVTADAPKLARISMKASKLNLIALGPLLFAMVVPNNLPGLAHWAMGASIVVGAGFFLGLTKKATRIQIDLPPQALAPTEPTPTSETSQSGAPSTSGA